MSAERTTDRLGPGDKLAPLSLHVSAEFNESIMQSIGADATRYVSSGGAGIVHPALLIVFSNLTRSPSFRLPPDCAAIQTHDDVSLERAARVGDTFTISWQVADTYERRGRRYQEMKTRVADGEGRTVLTRKTTNTFMGGGHPGA